MRPEIRLRGGLLLGFGILASAGAVGTADFGPEWTESERATLRSLWLGSLEPLPPDPSNAFADDPAAAELGERLFFDTGSSANGAVSCATCHRPELSFQDGTALARGLGSTSRRTMPIAGTAYSPWQFWDGRSDSQWSQALGPLESAVEHGTDRTAVAHLVAARYREAYERVFGPLPPLAHLPRRAGPVEDPTARAAWEALAAEERDAITRIFVNVGKAIAAYERTLLPGPSRFDRYVELVLDGDAEGASRVLSEEEVEGLRLFIGEARCVDCHNGPRLTDDFFHNTGVPAAASLPRDLGRAVGAAEVRASEFNCMGPYSDATASDCSELRFMVAEGEELLRAFKTPSLRGVADRAPYMHAGQIATLSDVVAHYDRAPRAPEGRTELTRLRLGKRERAQLEAFLRTLDGPVVVSAQPLPMAAPDAEER